MRNFAVVDEPTGCSCRADSKDLEIRFDARIEPTQHTSINRAGPAPPPQASTKSHTGSGHEIMALQVQMVVSENKMIGEKIVSPRLVNLQSLAFDDFCDFVAQGSTVTAADVSAVMKQLEKNIPFILSLNTKVNVSPEGLVFRPSVKGSITQSQLAAKLSARRQAYLDAGDTESAEKINVNRALESADLSVNDLQACIVIDLPKRWDTRFKQQVEFKRVTKSASMMSDSENGDDTTYTLSVSTANPAMGTVDTSVNKSYAPGTQVTVKATPASGYAFDQWSDGNTSATRTLTMNSNLNLVASFKTSTSSGSGSDEEGGGLGA